MSDPIGEVPRSDGKLKVVAVALLIGLLLGLAGSALWFLDRPGLTSDELTTALGVRYWHFTIPPDAESKFLTFEVRDGDEVRTHGGSSHWTPGETVTVTVRPLMHVKKLECSIMGNNRSHRFLLDNVFSEIHVLYTPNGESVNDVPLIKGNRTGQVQLVPINEQNEGDVFLYLRFDDE